MIGIWYFFIILFLKKEEFVLDFGVILCKREVIIDYLDKNEGNKY